MIKLENSLNFVLCKDLTEKGKRNIVETEQ